MTLVLCLTFPLAAFQLESKQEHCSFCHFKSKRDIEGILCPFPVPLLSPAL